MNWHRLRHFRPDERTPWGEPAFPQPDRMDERLLLELDDLRHYVRRPVLVHRSIGTGSVGGSQHPLGRAVDVSCPGLSLLDFWTAALRYGFTGLGVYPGWNRPGLHLDTRELVDGEPRALWWAEESPPGRAYHSIDARGVRAVLDVRGPHA